MKKRYLWLLAAWLMCGTAMALTLNEASSKGAWAKR